MRFAIVKNDIVTSVIIAGQEQKAELEAALNVELTDASVYGLAPGDMRSGGVWTRNIDGEQVILTEARSLEETVEALRLEVQSLQEQMSAMGGGE